MVSEFIITNLTNKNSLRFGQMSGYDVLFKEGGIDFGAVPATHNTYAYPSQVGVSISTTTVREREVTIEGYCYYTPRKEEIGLPRDVILEIVKKNILVKKRILNRLLNPLDFVKIEVGNYYMSGKPSQAIVYGNEIETNNEWFVKFLIIVYCADPMFRMSNADEHEIGNVVGKWHFPWIIPKEHPDGFPPYGTIMSIRNPYRIIPIDNNGDIEVGAIITIIAKRQSTNPVIFNMKNNQEIRINKTLSVNEKIIINTNDGANKGIKGIVDNVESDYFRYWDLNNKWIKFPVGTNLVGYRVDDDELENLLVTITLSEARYSLEVL